VNRLRRHLYHTRHVHRLHAQIIDWQRDFDKAANDATRAICAEQIAARLGEQAFHLEMSRLARLTVFLPAPDAIRAEADNWNRRAAGFWASAPKVA
jgi:hypothetical protein